MNIFSENSTDWHWSLFEQLLFSYRRHTQKSVKLRKACALTHNICEYRKQIAEEKNRFIRREELGIDFLAGTSQRKGSRIPFSFNTEIACSVDASFVPKRHIVRSLFPSTATCSKGQQLHTVIISRFQSQCVPSILYIYVLVHVSKICTLFRSTAFPFSLSPSQCLALFSPAVHHISSISTPFYFVFQHFVFHHHHRHRPLSIFCFFKFSCCSIRLSFSSSDFLN